MVQLSTLLGWPLTGNGPPVRRFLSNYFDLLFFFSIGNKGVLYILFSLPPPPPFCGIRFWSSNILMLIVKCWRSVKCVSIAALSLMSSCPLYVAVSKECLITSPVGVGHLSHAAQALKFKIALPRSFVPRSIEYTCQVSLTSAQQFRSLGVVENVYTAQTDIRPVVQVISGELTKKDKLIKVLRMRSLCYIVWNFYSNSNSLIFLWLIHETVKYFLWV